jgi:hypothetical protein
MRKPVRALRWWFIAVKAIDLRGLINPCYSNFMVSPVPERYIENVSCKPAFSIGNSFAPSKGPCIVAVMFDGVCALGLNLMLASCRFSDIIKVSLAAFSIVKGMVLIVFK